MKKLIESIDLISTKGSITSEPKKKGAQVEETFEDKDDNQFPEYMGGYVTPFTTNGGWVLDNEGTQVLKCDNPHFARVVAIALNKSR